MSQLLALPLYRLTDSNGVIIPNGRLYSFLTGTTTPAATYTTDELNVSHGNYVQANSAGLLPAIYIDPTVTYRFQVRATPYSAAVSGMDFDPVTATDASAVTFTPAGTGAVTRTVESKLRETVSALDFIPVAYHAAIEDHTSTVEVTSYINALSAELTERGGGAILFPVGTYRVGDLEITEGVTFVGAAPTYGGFEPENMRTRFMAINNPDWIIDTSATGALMAGVQGILLQGDENCGGMRFRSTGSAGWCPTIAHCVIRDVGEQAILIDAGVANAHICRVLAFNSVLNRTRAQLTGVVEIRGTDACLTAVEANPSLASSEGTNGIISSNLYICGILLTGVNNFVGSGCIGEFAERGIHNTQPSTQISNARCDLNWGHGFSGTGMLSNCKAYNNSQAANNTYDGFFTDNTQSGRSSGCSAQVVSVSNAHRYGWNGNGASLSAVTDRHMVRGFSSIGHGTAAVNQAANGLYPHDVESMGGVSQGDVSATPSAENISILIPTNGSAVTVTSIGGGYLGKEIKIIPSTANITLAHDTGNIFTNTGADKTLALKKVYTFVYLNIAGVVRWYEVSDA